MKVVASPHEAYAHVNHWRSEGLSVGLIPTMGALHAGHLALVKRSASENAITAATIFVNPTQFAPHEDLSRYPRTLESDLEGLRAAKCDLVFVPQNEALYPQVSQLMSNRPPQPLHWKASVGRATIAAFAPWS